MSTSPSASPANQEFPAREGGEAWWQLAAGSRVPAVTLTLWGFPQSRYFWALAQMALARPFLRKLPGLRFWKLLGSGRGRGFSLKPDWSRYGLLAVWEEPASARRFFAEHRLAERYRRHARESWTVWLRPIYSRGCWSGSNPFLPVGAPPEWDGPLAILTRATIRLHRLPAFWGAVPAVSAPLVQTEGLLASIGVGEAPLYRQATISFWRRPADARAYAYRNAAHQEAIRRTRAEDWYAEELFARFIPVITAGTWNGEDPLAGYQANKFY